MDVAKNIKRLTRSPARRAVAAADALRDARNWAGAADAYEKALALDPNRAAIWVQYGHALKESGKVEEAEAAYRRAISIDDQNADSHVQLGHALKISGRLAEAARAYMAAFELDPSLSEALREIQDPGPARHARARRQAGGRHGPAFPQRAVRHRAVAIGRQCGRARSSA